MKLTGILLLAGLLQVSAAGWSQNQKVDVDLENAPIEEFMAAIENQTDFRFVYLNETVQDKLITVKATNTAVTKLLKKSFYEVGLNYKILDKLVIITPDGADGEMQQFAVSGTVTDENGDPLPGVSISLKGTTRGTVTGLQGEYTLEIDDPSNTVLVFSFVGYLSREISVEGQTTIDISLEPDLIGLEEVVVIGYGTMKKSDLTGAIVSIDESQLANTVSPTFDQALQGRAAGVQVMVNSGQPGSATTIRIRGTNSLLGNNEPLYIIDGIQVSGENESAIMLGNGANSRAERTSPLSTLNPADIESIEVLKDASAAAIYGNRGANGVIIVTTKKGKSNEAKVNYEYSTGFKTLAKKIDLLGLQDYARYINEQNVVQNRPAREDFANPESLTGGTDWQDEFFETGRINTHYLSMSGGTDKLTYYISGGYTDDSGPVVNSWMKRYTFRTNLESNLNKYIHLGNNFSFGRSDIKYVFSDAFYSPIYIVLHKAPDTPVYDENGDYVGVLPGQETNGGQNEQANPIALTEDRDSRKKKFDVYDNAHIDVILGSLRFKTEFSFAGRTGEDVGFLRSSTYPGYYSGVSTLSERFSNSFGFELKNILSYSNTFGVHNVNAMVAHEARMGSSRNISGGGGDFYNNNLNSLSLSDQTNITTGGSRGIWRSESYISRLFYNYNNLFLLTTSLRADGSQNFAEGNRWGYFPSFSGAVRISNFSFFKNTVTAVNNLKINGGWGMVGSDDVLGGLYRPLVSVRPATTGGYATSFRNYDENITWEKTASANLGLEIGMFRNRLNMQYELYKKKTTDALNRLLLPASVGTNLSVVSNIASIENKGFEATINSVNTTGDLVWQTDFTFTLNRNKILDLGEAGETVYGGSVSKNTVGGPIGRFWGYQADEIYTDFDDIALSARWDGFSTIDRVSGIFIGDYKFVDVDPETNTADWQIIGYTGDQDADGYYVPGTASYTGDPADYITIKDASIIDENDQTYIGNPNPKFTFGINNSFSYKNFDLNIYLFCVYGNDLVNGTKMRLLQTWAYNKNTLAIVKDRAIPVLNSGGDVDNIFDYTLKNPDSEVPRLRNAAVFSDAAMSSRWVEDGSYLRIQNVSLGYTVPRNLISRLKISSLRAYVNAQNLMTFTKYTGWDPEIGSQDQNSMITGYDEGHYPVPRIITVGAQLGF